MKKKSIIISLLVALVVVIGVAVGVKAFVDHQAAKNQRIVATSAGFT